MKLNKNASAAVIGKIRVISEEDPKIAALREIADKKTDDYSARMIEMSDWICANPETGFLEFKANKMITDELKKYGFEVEIGVPNLVENIDVLKTLGGLPSSYDGPPGIPTAFRAKYKGKTEAPVIGFMVEYDALRSDPPFHGCQHNMQGPTGLGAAIALAQTMEENNIPGSVWVFGTPAEEVGPESKALMHKAGYFDGVDFFIRSHGTKEKSERAPSGWGSMSVRQMHYTFHGKVCHAVFPWQGKSALEAGILFFNGVNSLRHLSEPQFRFHGIFSNGGVAPNVIPDLITVPFWVRYVIDETKLGNVSPRIAGEMIDAKVEQINNIARSAALATNCTVDIVMYGTAVPCISVGLLNDIAFQYALDYGAQNISEIKTLNKDVGVSPSYLSYEETGLVSLDIPGVMVRFNFPGVPQDSFLPHSYESLKIGISEAGHNSLVLTAKTMQAVGLRLAMDKEIRKRVVEEYVRVKEKYI